MERSTAGPIRTHRALAALALSLTAAVGSDAVAGQSSGPVIYPARGQSAQQQDHDKYQCHGWAREQSGFDPMQPAPSTAASTRPGPMPSPPGLARGAAMGAAVGELTSHDPGRGAAAGVVGSVVMQGVRQRQSAQAAQQQAARQQAERGQQKAVFDRAFGACMEARGYAVK